MIAVRFLRLRVCVMDLLKACDEMKDFIGTAQKLVVAWDADRTLFAVGRGAIRLEG